jgi:hypothetical protein
MTLSHSGKDLPRVNSTFRVCLHGVVDRKDAFSQGDVQLHFFIEERSYLVRSEQATKVSASLSLLKRGSFFFMSDLPLSGAK